MSSPTPIELRHKAKKDVIDAIDQMVREKFASQENKLDFDSRFALIEQRNRVAKIFGIDQKGMRYFDVLR
ncbi:hypothetical protein PP935_gp065 [Rhizobium phage RHph_N34]|uniref:Uncharacterized protein n=2 Tax=Trinifflemingvirus TaxID=3044848 RepID=A0A7S5RJB1_9CAUD|nr:hypothetical protein PP935_gp065 [Rhizobium phage RHph_N34]YP_010661700.1 hypothetical protein PP936_gp062 [Rhizobium phage RHph_I1_9]QIG69632.1 hypothetical protein EVB81_063 [Rhizobium phage RHph_I46]QIG70913.1 hypothetical protein EVB92_063 [Rhizobium phage RHph_I9]QIG76252.1 hypothetical protein EVC25_063 [Rhizobium phage RHph_I34]QIG73499.1 hypothetical protein EVC04_062 [Rhizobium phage RHph_I1_9]QIG73840.1 hypothetical protein EVC06_065 [Rhizobium phage RHph_N34]